MKKNYFTNIFEKKRCRTTDIDLEIFHNVWLKCHLDSWNIKV